MEADEYNKQKSTIKLAKCNKGTYYMKEGPDDMAGVFGGE